MHLGVKYGELTLFGTDGRPASSPQLQAADESIQTIRGGLKAKLQPLGLTVLRRAGIRSGDAFILVVDNDRTSVACILGAMILQCICTLVSKNRMNLIKYVKTHTGITRVLMVDDTTESVIVEDDVKATDPTNNAAANLWIRDEEIISKGCVCLLTSGSVGTPKVVLCTWNRMLLQGESTHQQLFPKRSARIICSTSISHAFAINTIFALYTSPCDAQSELCFSSSAVGIYKLLAQHSGLFKVLYATPGIYTALAMMPPTPLYADVSYCAGARVCIPLFQKMRDDFGLILMQNYGSTETGNIAAWILNGTTLDTEIKNMDSNENVQYVGSLWPGVESQITDEGEIVIKTPWQSVGYVANCMLHRFYEAYHSSDLGIIIRYENKIDHIWLYGRLRPEVEIEWQGQRMKFSPDKIEKVLLAHSQVTDALILVQNETFRKQGIIQARIVQDNRFGVIALDMKQWLIDRDMVPLCDSLLIELAEYLPCSPAGKLIYT
ncbi:amp-dependent synthetase and ligase [Plasmopara halstedii]|uniref:Amp-dependent synthetase and ligase n=1 Tax=Plasmopara halstedii TaxID=4781 RepID=A0A0P1AE15_PLAHL|nr:amp-dependent synthetase and ligase [Plasmopara halstedii]CEG39189.1 amp-dependent synthetase and ligase [Plasmopara halstedii]|eukprot:XP_024575558.1 amp-dependent synthetase and ligase [Plasmopara halstedii]